MLYTLYTQSIGCCGDVLGVLWCAVLIRILRDGKVYPMYETVGKPASSFLRVCCEMRVLHCWTGVDNRGWTLVFQSFGILLIARER